MKNIAVITGASSGLGKCFVEKICQDSRYIFDEIWLIARRAEPMILLSKKYRNQKFKIIVLDLSRDDAYLSYQKNLQNEKVNVKLLINNAGFGKTGLFGAISYESQQEMIQVNIKAVTALTHMSLPYMNEKSQIINVASAAGFMPQPYFTVYAATKAYVLSFSRALNQELKSNRIKVLAVCPGPVDTEFFNTAGEMKAFKKVMFKTCEDVVGKALRDARKGKDMSVCGFIMNAFRMLAKIIPHRVLMLGLKNPS